MQGAPVLIKTPPSKSSPGRRWALRSPLFSLSPNKRSAEQRTEVEKEDSARSTAPSDVASGLALEPNDMEKKNTGSTSASPVELRQQHASRAPTTPLPYEARNLLPEQSGQPIPAGKRRKTAKPLSLRSRILLAIRQ